jgi:hypothetical protein
MFGMKVHLTNDSDEHNTSTSHNMNKTTKKQQLQQ